MRARKQGLVDFKGEMLYQRRDDHVLIRLIRTPEDLMNSIEQQIAELKHHPASKHWKTENNLQSPFASHLKPAQRPPWNDAKSDHDRGQESEKTPNSFHDHEICQYHLLLCLSFFPLTNFVSTTNIGFCYIQQHSLKLAPLCCANSGLSYNCTRPGLDLALQQVMW